MHMHECELMEVLGTRIGLISFSILIKRTVMNQAWWNEVCVHRKIFLYNMQVVWWGFFGSMKLYIIVTLNTIMYQWDGDVTCQMNFWELMKLHIKLTMY